jgi:hypothetical protein
MCSVIRKSLSRGCSSATDTRVKGFATNWGETAPRVAKGTQDNGEHAKMFHAPAAGELRSWVAPKRKYWTRLQLAEIIERECNDLLALNPFYVLSQFHQTKYDST